jgi:uncharacterized sulfatase
VKKILMLALSLCALAGLAPAGVTVATALAADAGRFDYGLRPERIAENTWVVVGRREDFTTENGGNIVNTAFVATGAGVVVIDTGSSKRYGEQLLAAIASVTDEPVAMVLNTHFHPDHFLGNQAFPADRLFALPATIRGIAADGNAFAENLYRMSGDWMRGTEVVVPPNPLAPGPLRVGRHDFEVLALGGHTEADLALYDRTTGVLFASDLVFNERAPTTPHAHLGNWLSALDRLEATGAALVVPGHGPVSRDGGAIAQTRAYLGWLERTLNDAAERGLDMTEVLALPVPASIRRIALAEAEYRRSVVHLYPAAEQRALARAGQR